MFLSIVVAVFLLSAGSAFKIQPKIFNGFPAQDPTQFPYYVFLEMSMQKGTFSCKFFKFIVTNYLKIKIYNIFSGGGTIISDEWVVTAAHCLDLDFSHVYVHFVAWKLGERHPALEVDENGIFIHPEWDADIVHNDIALIRLPRQIKLSPAVQPIKFSQNCYTNEVDLNVYAVGNGARSMNTEGLPEVLQYAPLQTISWQLCRRYFSPMKFPRNVVCAASRARRSVCKGKFDTFSDF